VSVMSTNKSLKRPARRARSSTVTMSAPPALCCVPSPAVRIDPRRCQANYTRGRRNTYVDVITRNTSRPDSLTLPRRPLPVLSHTVQPTAAAAANIHSSSLNFGSLIALIVRVFSMYGSTSCTPVPYNSNNTPISGIILQL